MLVPRLLAPENLVKKEFGGQPIKARDLVNFFKTFMEVFKDIDLPEPTTLVEVRCVYPARWGCLRYVCHTCRGTLCLSCKVGLSELCVSHLSRYAVFVL